MTVPVTFQDKLREKIMASFVDLIEPEQLNKLLDAEIKAFFETPQMLTVESTKESVQNPSSYHTTTREYLTLGSKMTPFRQMVWQVLHAFLRPRFEADLADETSTLRVGIETWLKEAKVETGKTASEMMANLSINMAQVAHARMMFDAVDTAHKNLYFAMQQMGANTSMMNDTPYLKAPDPDRTTPGGDPSKNVSRSY